MEYEQYQAYAAAEHISFGETVRRGMRAWYASISNPPAISTNGKDHHPSARGSSHAD